MLKLNYINRYPKKFIQKKLVSYIIGITLEEVKKLNEINIDENSELSVVLCKNEEMREYNKTYRNKDYPTDVLSFPDGEKIGKYTYLGDIIISIDKVYEQSKEFEVKPIEEFVRLLVHGVLHLLGYDHETSEEDEKEMMELQDKIIDKILATINWKTLLI